MPNNVERIYQRIREQTHAVVLIKESNGGTGSMCQSRANTFDIFLNPNIEENYFWEVLLHEHIHVLQIKQGYYDIVSKNNQDVDITKRLNNITLDIDVIYRLENDYRFIRDSEYGKNLFFMGALPEIIQYKCNQSNIYDTKMVSMLVGFTYFAFGYEYAKSIFSNIENKKFHYYYEKFVEFVSLYLKRRTKSTFNTLQKELINLYDLRATVLSF